MKITDLEEEKKFKEIEESMRQEGKKCEIPKSLQPETVEEMLKNIERKKKKKGAIRKRIAMAASVLIVAGAACYMGLGRGQGDSSNSKIANDSAELAEATDGQEVLDEILASDDVVKEDGLDEAEESAVDSEEKETTEDSASSSSATEDTIDTGIITSPNLMGESGGSLLQKQDNYYFSVSHDTSSAQNDKVVITKTDKEDYETVTELTENQTIQELYVREHVLAVISSHDTSTTIHTYNIKDINNIDTIATVSLDGAWESSCRQNDDLYVFTVNGKIEHVSLSENSTGGVTFDLGVSNAQYFMDGDDIYAFYDNDEKLFIQHYTLKPDSVEKGETLSISGSLERIIAVSKSADYLKVAFGTISKGTSAVILYMIDSDMQIYKKVKNERNSEKNESAVFIQNGGFKDMLLCFAGGYTSDTEKTIDGLALSLYKTGDDDSLEAAANVYYISEIINAPVYYASNLAFIDSENEYIGFDAYVIENGSEVRKYYVVKLQDETFDLVQEMDITSFGMGQKVYSSYDGSYIYLTDEYGRIQVLNGK